MLTTIFEQRLKALFDNLLHFHLCCDHPFGLQLTLNFRVNHELLNLRRL
jgi:hypothetical protein